MSVFRVLFAETPFESSLCSVFFYSMPRLILVVHKLRFFLEKFHTLLYGRWVQCVKDESVAYSAIVRKVQ